MSSGLLALVIVIYFVVVFLEHIGSFNALLQFGEVEVNEHCMG